VSAVAELDGMLILAGAPLGPAGVPRAGGATVLSYEDPAISLRADSSDSQIRRFSAVLMLDR
jgi:hypothetical protein